MVEIISAKEHNLEIRGERQDIEYLVELLREAQPEGTLGDLLYKLELDVDDELRQQVSDEA